MPLKVGKRKDRPGGALWITGTVHGRVIRRSAGTGDRRAAQELANQIEARIMREVLHGPAAVITLAQACAAYVSEGGSPRFLEPVMRHFGADALLRDITGEVAREAAVAIYPTAQPATRNRQAIAPISAVVNFGHRKGWCGPLRIERFSVPRKARRFASAEWIRQFRDACSNARVRAAVTLMFVTGARIGSVVKLAPDDLRLGECLVIFRDTKNGDDHEAIIPSKLAEEIAALPSSDPVFGYTAENGLRGAMYAVCERHGIERLTPHEAGRHGFGAMAREMTAGDDAKAAKAGGWKSVDMYRRAYAHTDDSRRDIARQMGEAIYTGDAPEASETEISAIKQGLRE